jgi:outer membrane protein assembly factor BamB
MEPGGYAPYTFGTNLAVSGPVTSPSRAWTTFCAVVLGLVCLLAVTPGRAQAAIAFRAAASANLNDDAPSITINRPAGTQKGDVLIAIIAIRPHTVTITTVPTGFTLVNRQNNPNGSVNALAVYAKVATSTEPASYTWSLSSNTGSSGGILAFSGVDNASPIDAVAGSIRTTSGTTIGAPGVTPSVANTMIVAAHEIASSGRWTAPTGMTEAFDVASLAVTDELGISALGSYRTQAGTTATGTLTASNNAPADTGAGITLALRPVVCGAVAADPDYFAATARNGQVVLYWSSAAPVVILRKDSAFGSEAPASGVTYAVNDAIGAATVVYAGSAQTTTQVVPNGTYFYKAFVRDATPCYSSGTTLRAEPALGPAPAWSYTMAGGSMLNAGIPGAGTVYTSSNANNIVSLNTADGAQTWTPLGTTAAIQSTLTAIDVDTGIRSVQTGTATLTTQSVLDVTLPRPVDLSRSVLFMTVSADNDEPNEGLVRGQLTGASTIRFTRTATTTTLTIAWQVASFGRSVSVQRGTTSVTASPVNVAIGAVDRTKTFVLTSWQKIGSTYGADDVLRARLTSNTTLEFSHGTGSFDGIADWQVVTMESASVQSGDATLAATDPFVTVPVTAVDTTKTFLLASWTSAGDGIGANFIRGRIISPTQLRFDRGVTGTAISLTWYLVTLNDGSSVQWNNRSFGAGETTASVVLPTPVTLGRAVAFLSGSQRGGSTPYAGASPADNPGVAWFRAELTGPTGLQLTRGNTLGATAEAAWFVVDFATGPGQAVIGGDQGGSVYYVDTQTGLAQWATTLSGANAVQAATSAQLLAWPNGAGFSTAMTDDLVFAATRNASTTNNRVFALRASDGAVQWTFNGTGAYQMDYVVGTPWVDITRNRLYVASRAGSGGLQPTLWVINTLNGTLVQSFALGHLQTSPTLSWDETTLYVGNTSGRLYAISAATLTQKWPGTVNLGSALLGYVSEDDNTAGRLYFTTANGNVWCLQDPGAGSTPNPNAPVWRRAVAGASPPLVQGPLLYVGSSDGAVHEIDLASGVDQRQFTVGDGAATVGTPSTEDGSQLFVGTTAGTLYAIPLPLP